MPDVLNKHLECQSAPNSCQTKHIHKHVLNSTEQRPTFALNMKDKCEPFFVHLPTSSPLHPMKPTPLTGSLELIAYSSF